MLDDLFSKSLKPKISITNRKDRKFIDRNADKFKPKREKEVRLYSGGIVESVNDKELKFTNHYSSQTPHNVIERIKELSNDLNIVRDLSPTTVDFSEKRISDIIKIYIKDFDPNELNEDRVRKVAPLSPLGQQDGVRIYFIISQDFDAYEIILIDLFHLVIPSAHTNKGNRKRNDKVTMLNNTYEKNKHNKECISEFFNIS